jgi:hypothetical protein
MSGGRTRPPALLVRTRVGHRRDRGGRPGARPGRRPSRPAQHDGQPAPPVRSPGPPGRRGQRRSWSGAGPHRTRGRHRGHAGGPTARRSWGSGPRTYAGSSPTMLRPAARGRWRRRRTSGPGTHRGRIGTVRGRWPARGCNTPPGRPRVWRCRPPPRRFPPALVGASERTPGALLSSENGLEMRVSRKQACERRLPGVRGCGYFVVRRDRQWKEAVLTGAVDG